MTDFKEIYSLFLGTISNDYRITRLFQTDPKTAEDMLEVWLKKAVVLFQQNVDFDLIDNLNWEERTFDISIGLMEQSILSDLMILVWLEWNIHNIVDMNLNLNDLDYKHFSEEKNLIAKQAYCDGFREKVYHQMSQYNLNNIPFADWASGNYG